MCKYYFSPRHHCVQHQFVNKINVISSAGAASSADAGTTVDRPSNPQLLQQLVDKAYVSLLLENSLSILAF